MKLLIDIPEHIYEHAKEGTEDSRDEGEAMRAIANGSQQRTGQWLKTRLDDEPDKICDSCGTYCWKCSLCRCDASGWGNFKYCPNCGAKMEVEG